MKAIASIWDIPPDRAEYYLSLHKPYIQVNLYAKQIMLFLPKSDVSVYVLVPLVPFRFLSSYSTLTCSLCFEHLWCILQGTPTVLHVGRAVLEVFPSRVKIQAVCSQDYLILFNIDCLLYSRPTFTRVVNQLLLLPLQAMCLDSWNALPVVSNGKSLFCLWEKQAQEKPLWCSSWPKDQETPWLSLWERSPNFALLLSPTLTHFRDCLYNRTTLVYSFPFSHHTIDE